MEITTLLEYSDRSQLRAWLQENHSKEKECWVVFIMLSVIGFNFICEAPVRADDGNRQENPTKYYHSVRGDFDGLR